MIIKEVVGLNDLKGVLVGKTMTLSRLLFFVDVVLLLYFGDEYNLRRTLELLDIFCVGNGMEVNYNKSDYYCYNINMALLNRFNTFCPFGNYDLNE